MPWFLHRARWAMLVNNSGEAPKLMGTKAGNVLTLTVDALPEVLTAAREAERLGTEVRWPDSWARHSG